MSFIAPRTDPPIESPREIHAYFERGCKPQSLHRIGIEMEALPVDPATARPVPFDGPRGVEAVLGELARFPCYQAVREEGRLVFLRCEERTIGCEPGGQIELSGTPALLLSEVKAELDLYLRELWAASGPLGVGWLAMGEHPVARLEEIPWVPKPRYELLSSFLLGRGPLGHHMMKKTATVQASFDYESLEDAMGKLRVALLATPVIVALSANSPYADGRATGAVSHRTLVWEGTDPSRSGRFDKALARGFGIEAYLDHVLDLPMVFLRRGDRWIDPRGMSFRRFLAEGLEGERATLFDWELHLSSFFPDARAKQVIEVRGADCPPPLLVVPIVAFMTGLLYGKAARDDVESLLGKLAPADHAALQHEAALRGLAGSHGKLLLAELAREMLHAAGQALRERAALVGVDESGLLDPLHELAAREASPAHELLARHGDVVRDPAALVQDRAMRPR